MQREGSCYLCGGKPVHRLRWRMTLDEPESAANYCDVHGPEEVEYLKGRGAVEVEITDIVDEQGDASGPTPLP